MNFPRPALKHAAIIRCQRGGAGGYPRARAPSRRLAVARVPLALQVFGQVRTPTPRPLAPPTPLPVAVLGAPPTTRPRPRPRAGHSRRLWRRVPLRGRQPVRRSPPMTFPSPPGLTPGRATAEKRSRPAGDRITARSSHVIRPPVGLRWIERPSKPIGRTLMPHKREARHAPTPPTGLSRVVLANRTISDCYATYGRKRPRYRARSGYIA